LVAGIYLLAQVGGPTLQAQGSPTATSSNCSIFLEQPSTPPTSSSPSPTTFSTHLSFAIDSPALAFWIMPTAMGAPFTVAGSGVSINIGLFGGNCGPGSKGGGFYFLLLLPAISIFVGGWLAARKAQVRTAGEAAGVGLL